MVIDFHTHCFPDNLAEQSIKKLENASSLTSWHRGNASSLIASMQDGGIDKSVVLSIAVKKEQTKKVNDFAISLLKYKELIPFGSIHPYYEDAESELHRLKMAGIKGIKLHLDYQNVPVDSREVIELCKKAGSVGLIVSFHAGVDIGISPPYNCTPKASRTLIDSAFDTTMIFAHMGGYNYFEDAEKYLLGTPVYIDTSFCSKRMDKDLFIHMITTHKNVLFGTDSPWDSQKEQYEFFKDLPLDNALKENILYKNAVELLNLGE